jgi:hypothetical protein
MTTSFMAPLQAGSPTVFFPAQLSLPTSIAYDTTGVNALKVRGTLGTIKPVMRPAFLMRFTLDLQRTRQLASVESLMELSNVSVIFVEQHAVGVITTAAPHFELPQPRLLFGPFLRPL